MKRGLPVPRKAWNSPQIRAMSQTNTTTKTRVRTKVERPKLYKVILRNNSNDPHYFTSHAFSAMVWTRKTQVTQQRDGKSVTLAEFKGAMREIEVYPGHSAEWWLVPVAAGRATDLRCDIKGADGKTHAELGMTGEIIIE